jgi:hypothetical protein
MLAASAGHRYFLGFLRGTSRVAIPHLSLPIHTSGTKKRGTELLHVFLASPTRAGLMLREKSAMSTALPSY